MSSSYGITTFLNISDAAFDYHLISLSNTWNYVVTHPFSAGENSNCLSCSYEKYQLKQVLRAQFGVIKLTATECTQYFEILSRMA